MSDKRQAHAASEFSAAEIGALAHLYRAEVYRSTIWRTRLDTTTNWAVVTLGVALSITFSAPNASPVPLLLVGILIMLFLALEARRYRYFNVFRARSRWLERFFYTPMLRDGDLHTEDDWQTVLAEDYFTPRYHVSFPVAVARRVRHNYLWILLIQSVAYIGKLVVHPFPVSSLDNFIHRARIGPLIPGEVVLGLGGAYILAWVALAVWVGRRDAMLANRRGGLPTMG